MVAPRRLPSLASIRAFEAAARHGNFAKAAQELDTTAASVSYHVRRLEQETGVRLFMRFAQRVELTQPGALVAQEATAAFDALRASFLQAATVEETRLSLTTLPSLGTSWLTPKLGRFRAKHANIALEIELSPDAQDLAGGRFDAAIRNGHGAWPGLRALELFPSVFMPLCAPGLKEAAKALDDARRPLDVPLLGRQDWWALWYRARGRADVPASSHLGPLLSAEYLDIAAAVAGQGIAIGSPILFRTEIDAGRLIPAHDMVIDTGRTFWFTYPVAREQSRKIRAFRDWLADEAARDREAARVFLRKVKTVGATP
jgi:LysR family glycine cleavage system transcriptional activator